MANTYTLISSVTVGSGGASSIDFTSIPATYTDLVLKISMRDDETGAGNADLFMSFNSTGVNSTKVLYGYGSGVGSNSGNLIAGAGASAGNTANTFSSIDIYIPNYTSSSNKSISLDFVDEDNNTVAYSTLTAGLWTVTSAITSISLTTTSTKKFVQYSTAYLYGIKNS